MKTIYIICFAALSLIIFNACTNSDCFCDEDIYLYDNAFNERSHIVGWFNTEYLDIINNPANNNNCLLIRNSKLIPKAGFEFISHNEGKAKLKFKAQNIADKVECVFRNITNPQQIVIPINSGKFDNYDYTTLLDIKVGDNIAVEFYSSSDKDSILIIDDMKIVMMK